MVTGVSTVRSLVLELVNSTVMSSVASTFTLSSPVASAPSLIEAGRTTATVGAAKEPVLVATPPGVVTETGPAVAPTGTVALI